MELTEINNRLEALKDHIAIRLDIIGQDPKRWLGYNRPQLPEFGYYYKNCVLDKGGKYDFTVRRYKSHSQTVQTEEVTWINQNYIQGKSKKHKIYVTVEYSIWMSTPFNFKEKVEIN